MFQAKKFPWIEDVWIVKLWSRMFEANERFQLEEAYDFRICWCQECLKQSFFIVEYVPSEKVSLNRRCAKRKIMKSDMFEANERFQLEKAYDFRICWCQGSLKWNMFEARFFLSRTCSKWTSFIKSKIFEAENI